jgi:hypothetical protein
MQNAHSDRPTTSQRKPVRWFGKRTYVFIVVSLAVFAVSLVVWRPATIGFRAEATVAYRPKDVEGEKSLADIVSGSSVSETQFTISYVSPSKQQALAAVDKMARRFVEPRSGAARGAERAGDNSAAANRLGDLRQQATQARLALDNFLDQHVKALRQLNVSSNNERRRETSNDSTLAIGREESQGARPNANPDWLDLQQRLMTVTKQRDLILASRTAAHPEVQDLNWDIEQIRMRMENTPRYLPDTNGGSAAFGFSPPQDEPRESTQQLANSDASPSANSAELGALATASETFAKLQDNYAQTRQRLDVAEQQAEQQLLDRPATEALGTARLVEPAHITGQVIGGPTTGHFLTLALLALLAGALASWVVRGSPTTGTFTSVKQVAQRLPLPVVGQLSSSPNP